MDANSSSEYLSALSSKFLMASVKSFASVIKFSCSVFIVSLLLSQRSKEMASSIISSSSLSCKTGAGPANLVLIGANATPLRVASDLSSHHLLWKVTRVVSVWIC